MDFLGFLHPRRSRGLAVLLGLGLAACGPTLEIPDDDDPAASTGELDDDDPDVPDVPDASDGTGDPVPSDDTGPDDDCGVVGGRGPVADYPCGDEPAALVDALEGEHVAELVWAPHDGALVMSAPNDGLAQLRLVVEWTSEPVCISNCYGDNFEVDGRVELHTDDGALAESLTTTWQGRASPLPNGDSLWLFAALPAAGLAGSYELSAVANPDADVYLSIDASRDEAGGIRGVLRAVVTLADGTSDFVEVAHWGDPPR